MCVNYYFSGIYNFTVAQKEELSVLCEYRLQSLHKEYVKSARDWCSYAVRNNNKNEILLDSGAYSAWNKGKEVSLEPLIRLYSEFIEKYEHGLRKLWLINLDKIPGERGRTATPEELEEAVKISDVNFAILYRHFGDRVLPVFHQNETTARLHEVCGQANYICVSPRNDIAEKYRVAWASEVHGILAKEQGHIRTHGLATTGMVMLSNVQWFSVDSGWWVQVAISGSVFYLNHDGLLKTIQVSAKGNTAKVLGQHYGTVPPAMQEVLDRRLAVHGYTYKDVNEHHEPRFIHNLKEVLEWLKVSKNIPLNHKGLFDL